MSTIGATVKKHLLNASQRIDVDELIRRTTLNPQAFRWTVVHSETTRGTEVGRLEYKHASSQMFFQFDRFQRQHYALYSMGADLLEEHFAGTWPTQLLHVGRWLDRLSGASKTSNTDSYGG